MTKRVILAVQNTQMPFDPDITEWPDEEMAKGDMKVAADYAEIGFELWAAHDDNFVVTEK